jgi:DNA primase
MQTDVERIKDAISIVDVIQKYVSDLNKSGRLWKANCPFHDEKTPSFIVDDTKQRWHCFGSCNIGGDVIEFIKQIEKCEFIEALKICADIAGIELSYKENTKQKEIQNLFFSINDMAVDFYSQQLQLKDGQKYKTYLTSRSIQSNSMLLWKLGSTPSSIKGLCNYLTSKDISPDDMIKSGLAINRSDNDTKLDIIDRFRNKIMIPIINVNGHVIGFGARTIDNNMHPKYLNSPASPTFDKKSVLYGIDQAASTIRKKDLAIVAEGYFDVISCHQSGIQNVVASMGTAITGNQLKSMTKLSKNIVFALDGDAAGISAALKGIATANEELDGQNTATIDWKGLVSLQEKFSAKIKIATMPAGQDPDSLTQESSEAFLKIIEESMYITDYLIEHLIESKNITDPRDLSEAINRIIPSVAEMIDPIIRAHYSQKLSRLGKVDESHISQLIADQRKKMVRVLHPSRNKKQVTIKRDMNYGPEEQILRLILLGDADKNEVLSLLSNEIFEDSINKEIYTLINSEKAINVENQDIDTSILTKINSLMSIPLPAYLPEDIMSMITEISTRIQILRKKDIINKQAQDIADELQLKRTIQKNDNELDLEDKSQINLEESLEGLTEQSKELFQELRSESNEVVE